LADEKEKNGKVMVSRTPGGGRGVGRSQQADHSRTTPIAPITSTCTCLQTAPAREYSRRNPAAEPPTHGAQDPVRGVPPQPSPTCACKTKQGKARMSSAKAKAGRVRDAAALAAMSGVRTPAAGPPRHPGRTSLAPWAATAAAAHLRRQEKTQQHVSTVPFSPCRAGVLGYERRPGATSGLPRGLFHRARQVS